MIQNEPVDFLPPATFLFPNLAIKLENLNKRDRVSHVDRTRDFFQTAPTTKMIFVIFKYLIKEFMLLRAYILTENLFAQGVCIYFSSILIAFCLLASHWSGTFATVLMFGASFTIWTASGWIWICNII